MQSINTIRAGIEAGEQTARASIGACLDTIENREAEIGAFCALTGRQAALDHAQTATGPLAGIGIAVKDIFDSHDLPTAYGSPIYDGYRPRADAAISAMARRAGATVLGKTVTTEFAYLHPAGTRNPHNGQHTPGGSSSGSAAAVAAGMIPAAIGTQTGGSVIRPAAFCGIAGYKPSFRLLPTTGMKTFSWTLDTTGLFASTVSDVAILAEALTGRSLTGPPLAPRDLRVGLYRSAIWNDADPDMREAVERTAQQIADAGASVIEIAEPQLLSDARDIHSTIQDFEAGHALASDLALYGEQMSSILRETLEGGQAITPDIYDGARRVARHARKGATALFDQVDVLLSPSAPGAAPAGLGSTGISTFNKLWTLTGNPSLNVPGLKNAAALPLGMQLIARFGQDRLLLSAGSWLENVLKTD